MWLLAWWLAMGWGCPCPARGQQPLVPAPLMASWGSREREEGRRRLAEVREFARKPGFGRCWAQAVVRLGIGCQQLNEEQQSRIALSFTHCHLQRSGKTFPECLDTDTVRDCTRDMDALAFGVYTEFFTHTHSICHYLQSQAWQQQTQHTIHRLTVHADGVAEQLERASAASGAMLETQNQTLAAQREILETGSALKDTLQQSTQGVRRVFEEIQDTSQKQQRLFSEIFNRVAFLHQFVVTESVALHTFLYNLLATAITFLLTSTPRSSGARLMLLLLIGLNVYLEHIASSTEMHPSESSLDYTERVSQRVWLVRRLTVMCGILVWSYYVLTYRDIVRQNMEILQRLRETQRDLHTMLCHAEKILAGPMHTHVPSPWYTQTGETHADSDSAIVVSRLDITASPSKANRPQEENEEFATSTPRYRTPRPRARSPSRSPSRSRTTRGRTRRSEVSVYNILVSEENNSKYNLRQRNPGKSPAVI
ncbi:uncharacterized protein LOC121852790 [Callorhinchus milii]|uniref:uncharacterized protein LOC121852790 n=1 Tax=Callorhinchus milii TaxID=7868 RepID=UPI001C3FE625|nr:uncharacterized protein LOC121852790 [Callorhinchus milii]XP_042202622.1 uncharacterized protein LOC121852790 [Callorhinchus milii]